MEQQAAATRGMLYSTLTTQVKWYLSKDLHVKSN